MAPAAKEKKERKLTLPVGHPQAGYVSPDLSFVDERDPTELGEELAGERESEVEAVADNEDKVAKAELAAAAGEVEAKAKEAEKESAAAS